MAAIDLLSRFPTFSAFAFCWGGLSFACPRGRFGFALGLRLGFLFLVINLFQPLSRLLVSIIWDTRLISKPSAFLKRVFYVVVSMFIHSLGVVYAAVILLGFWFVLYRYAAAGGFLL